LVRFPPLIDCVFPHWGFVFGPNRRPPVLRLVAPGFSGDGFHALDRGPDFLVAGAIPRLELLPFVRRRSVVAVPIAKAKEVRAPEGLVTRTAGLSDFNEPKGSRFADRGTDGVGVHAKAHKVAMGYGQLPVIVAAMMTVLDLDPLQYPMSA